MKIVIDARESGSSTGRYIDKLIKYLQKTDKTNEYYLLLKSGRAKAYEDADINFHVVQCDIKEFTFAEQFQLKKLIEDLRPDLVHFGMVQQPVLYRGEVVTTMHDLTTLRFTNKSKNAVVFKIKQFVYKYVNKIVAKKSRVIITPSEFVKNDIVEFAKINPDKITVTPEAADRILEKPEPVQELIDKKYIMYVGRHQSHKNLEQLIKAHQKLLAINPDLFLAVAGKKDRVTKILEKNIDSKGYRNILFTGFVSEGQLRWMYENCEAYVFPSLSEGFGLPGIEAMIHGAPVVSSNATCLPEIYGDAAEYFNPLDTDDMVKKIGRVIASDELRKKLVKKGRIQASKYSWERMAEQTLAVYDKVLKS